MDRKLQYKHRWENAEAKRDKRRVTQNGRKNSPKPPPPTVHVTGFDRGKQGPYKPGTGRTN